VKNIEMEFIRTCCELVKDYEAENNIKYEKLIMRDIEAIPDTDIKVVSSLYIFKPDNIYTKINDLPDPCLIYNKLFGENRVIFYGTDIPAPKKTTFLLSSVIHNKSINNTWDNSIFSHEERLIQTLSQVETIKKKCPDSSIFLLECSELNLLEIYRLLKHIDTIIFFTRDTTAMSLSHGPTKSKNLAEIYITKSMFKILSDFSINHVVKMSGRYNLHENFSIDRLLTNKPTTRIAPAEESWTRTAYAYCAIYAIPKAYFSEYSSLLESAFINLPSYGYDMEHVLMYLSDIQSIEPIYISARLAGGPYYFI
jgi:hypothetical protein